MVFWATMSVLAVPNLDNAQPRGNNVWNDYQAFVVFFDSKEASA
jgi:hypothetical protein